MVRLTGPSFDTGDASWPQKSTVGGSAAGVQSRRVAEPVLTDSTDDRRQRAGGRPEWLARDPPVQFPATRLVGLDPFPQARLQYLGGTVGVVAQIEHYFQVRPASRCRPRVPPPAFRLDICNRVGGKCASPSSKLHLAELGQQRTGTVGRVIGRISISRVPPGDHGTRKPRLNAPSPTDTCIVAQALQA